MAKVLKIWRVTPPIIDQYVIGDIELQIDRDVRIKENTYTKNGCTFKAQANIDWMEIIYFDGTCSGTSSQSTWGELKEFYYNVKARDWAGYSSSSTITVQYQVGASNGVPYIIPINPRFYIRPCCIRAYL